VAQEKRITQIVLGQTMRSRFKALLRRPLSERLQHQLRGLSIDLHLISEGLPAQPANEAEP
jgi:two-component system sensor histidine kinase KdpD